MQAVLLLLALIVGCGMCASLFDGSGRSGYRSSYSSPSSGSSDRDSRLQRGYESYKSVPGDHMSFDEYKRLADDVGAK